MSRRDKLVRRIVARPPEADFGEVKSLLERYGWSLSRTKGSHFTFTREGVYPITIPVHNDKVRRPYLDRICERLGLDEPEDAVGVDDDETA
jgi:predicted RNA binding protein YcfA (HicA-like mRNA interferase family)